MRRILRRRDVERVTGLSRATIYRRIQDGGFPKPIPLGPGAVGWLECEVDAWIERRIDQRERATSDPGPDPAA